MSKRTCVGARTDAWFAPSEQGALQDFWDVYDASYDVVLAETFRASARHPELGEALKRMSADLVPAREPGGRELLRRAIAGDWATYEEHLRQRGRDFAELGLGFTAWRGVTTAFTTALTRRLTPLLVQAYADAPDRLTAALVAMQTFVDAVATTIGSEYLETRDRIARRSEARDAAILESALDGIISIDHEGRITELSASAERMFGYTRADVVGRLLEDVLIPERLRAAHRAGLARYVSTGQGRVIGTRVMLSALRRDGSEVPVELAIARIGADDPPTFTGFIRDVSDRRQAESELQLREARFRALVEKSSDVISLTAADGRVLYISPGIERLLGRKDVEIVGKSFSDFFHPDDHDRVHGVLGRVLGDPTVSQTVQFRVMHADGSTRWMESTATNLIADPAVGAIVGNSRDITDRKAAEDALRESEARFNRLWDSGIVGIMVGSPSGRITEANDAFLRMVGYSRDDLAAGHVNWNEMTPLEARDVNRTVGEQLQAWGVARPWEKEYVRKDGSRVPVLVAVATLEGSRVISLSVDLTERTRAIAALRTTEDQLRQMQKLDAIGSLAGGVAHDFNNVLSVILGYAGLLLDELNPDDAHRADVLEMQVAAQRATALTQQLLAFSRQQVLQPQVLDLNPILAGMETMLRRLLGEAIELTVVADLELGKVKADPGQMEQVIMNLAVNARDAMLKGGKLRIETRNVTFDGDEAARHHGVTPGPYVMIAVTDTGTGMDAATRARIFEPFFTTKERGKGTGLGLSTVFGIVRQSEGHVWVYSEPGLGTTFKVYLPRTADAASVSKTLSSAPRDLRGTETILLVEDEAQVRAVAKTILIRSGYHVLEASSGTDALLACAEHAGRIHLVLTDVVMPKMSGRQLAERIAVTRPDAKVLFMSGYTDDAIVHHGVLDGDVAFLQKPLTPGELLRKVREVLDSN